MVGSLEAGLDHSVLAEIRVIRTVIEVTQSTCLLASDATLTPMRAACRCLPAIKNAVIDASLTRKLRITMVSFMRVRENCALFHLFPLLQQFEVRSRLTCRSCYIRIIDVLHPVHKRFEDIANAIIVSDCDSYCEQMCLEFYE